METKLAVVRVSCNNADTTPLFSIGREPIIVLVFGDENIAHPAPEIDRPIIIISGPESIVKVENINAADPIKNIPNIEIHLVPNLSDNLPENGLIIAMKKAEEISNNPDTLVLYSNT